jgi:hypothetical protein
MPSAITSKFFPPLPRLRVTVKRVWIEGAHGFWVDRLCEREEWVAPWYGTRRDYEAIERAMNQRIRKLLDAIATVDR